jgi:hypothetical protein
VRRHLRLQLKRVEYQDLVLVDLRRVCLSQLGGEGIESDRDCGGMDKAEMGMGPEGGAGFPSW